MNTTREESFIDWLDGAEPQAQERLAFNYAWGIQQRKISNLERRLGIHKKFELCEGCGDPTDRPGKCCSDCAEILDA